MQPGARARPTSAPGTSAVVSPAAERAGQLRFHRPARTWPLLPSGGPIGLPPPPSAPAEQRRAWTTLLPMVGSVAMIGFAFVVHSVVYLVMIGLMVVAMVGAGLATTLVAHRDERSRLRAARRRYLDRVADARAASEEAMARQLAALERVHPPLPQIEAMVVRGDGVWERRRSDPDFGDVALGRGPVPAARPVVLPDPGPVTDQPDPEAAAAAEAAVAGTAWLADAPVAVSLVQPGVVAIVGDRRAARDLVGGWLVELAAFHAPSELRIAGIVPPDAIADWDWTKWLPHSRDPDAGGGLGRARRALTADPDAFTAGLAGLVQARLERRRRGVAAPGGADAPADTAPVAAVDGAEHVVVVVDGWNPGSAFPGRRHLAALMAAGGAAGVTVVTLVDGPGLVPSTCGATVTLAGDGAGPTARYVAGGPGGRVHQDIAVAPFDRAVAERVARRLAPLRLGASSAGSALGDSVRLVELLGTDDPEALADPGVLAGSPAAAAAAHGAGGPGAGGAGGAVEAATEGSPWGAAGSGGAATGPVPDAAGLLCTPIGRDDDGEPVVLDLKEAARGGSGPHGILIGATGSGKSEMLRAISFGLAARHHPDQLALLLVDYKGGAAFAGLRDLPHVSGLVTNLADEPALVERVRLAIAGELERRQRLLADAGNCDSLADYHRRVPRPAAEQRLPYLLVCVDEFGELLAAQPDFVDVFTAVGRLGRSLGVHLLLASQRIDEGRIRALEPHLRYRLALRTNTAGESRALLGTAAAFELAPVPGVGLLSVDGAITRFKGAIATLPHRPPARAARASACVRPLTLAPASAPAAGGPEAGEAGSAGPGPAAGDGTSPGTGTSRGPGTSPGTGDVPAHGGAGAAAHTELEAGVAALRRRGGRPAAPLWLPPLPAAVTWQALARRWPGAGPVVLGMVDEPARRAQGPLVWDPSGPGGNLGVAGAPRTGKSELLRTLVLALAATHRPSEAQCYCLDLGGGGLAPLADLPHVGAVVGAGEPEAASRLLEEVAALVDERAASRRSGATGGDGGRGTALWPRVVLVVDNVGALRQSLPDLEPPLAKVATSGLAQRVHLAVSANRWWDVRPQVLDALGTKLELRLGDPVETCTRREAARAVPLDTPGRGVTAAGSSFQAALASMAEEPGPPEDHLALAAAVARVAAGADGPRAPRIAPLPERVDEAGVAAAAAAAGSAPPDPSAGFLLGQAAHRAKPVQLDLLAPGAHLQVLGDAGSGRSTLLRRVLDHLAARPGPDGVRVHLVDPARALAAYARSPVVASYSVSAATAGEQLSALAALLQVRLPAGGAGVDGVEAWDPVAARLPGDPDHVVVVDDYDLLVGDLGGPLAPLADLLGQGPWIGLHVVVARRVTGSQRAQFEPFLRRLRELRPDTVVLAGSPDEGPIVDGVVARPGPPGRATAVLRGRPPQVVQCCAAATAPGAARP